MSVDMNTVIITVFATLTSICVAVIPFICKRYCVSNESDIERPDEKFNTLILKKGLDELKNDIEASILCDYDVTRNKLYKYILVNAFILPIEKYIDLLNTNDFINNLVGVKNNIVEEQKHALHKILRNISLEDIFHDALLSSFEDILTNEINNTINNIISNPDTIAEQKTKFVNDLYLIIKNHITCCRKFIKNINGKLDGFIFEGHVLRYSHNDVKMAYYDRIKLIVDKLYTTFNKNKNPIYFILCDYEKDDTPVVLYTHDIAHLYGYTENDGFNLIGKNPRILQINPVTGFVCDKNDEIRQLIKNRLKNKLDITGSIINYDKWGNEIVIFVSMFPLKVSEKTVFYIGIQQKINNETILLETANNLNKFINKLLKYDLHHLPNYILEVEKNNQLINCVYNLRDCENNLFSDTEGKQITDFIQIDFAKSIYHMNLFKGVPVNLEVNVMTNAYYVMFWIY